MLAKERGVSTFVLVVIVTAVMATLLAAFILFRHTATPLRAPSAGVPRMLSEEQKAYLPLLEFTDARMSAAENFLGDSVIYLDGRVTNKGTRFLRRLDVELRFVDILNQVVLRETAHPVTERTSPLKPGETRPFRITFEHMPADWNQAPPALTPTSVEFE
jgi:hypothetical protein